MELKFDDIWHLSFLEIFSIVIRQIMTKEKNITKVPKVCFLTQVFSIEI